MQFTDSHGNIIPLPPSGHVSWRVSGYALIRDMQGRYLMVQSGSGQWHFPGGGIEKTETIAEGLIREIQEETGYKLSIKRQELFTLHEQRFYHSREQNFYHSIQLFYMAQLATAESDENLMSPRDRTRARAWLSLADLQPDTIHPSVTTIIEQLRAVT